MDGQKRFVLDTMRDVYFWYRDLPAQVDLAAFATPEDLLEHLISFQPLDRDFSTISPAAAFAAFFDEGQTESFGFNSFLETPDALRIFRVFSGSPADSAGLARGQRIIAINGRTLPEIEAAEGLLAIFELPSLEFTIRRLDDSQFTVTVDVGVFTLDPLPQWRVIDTPGGLSFGYVELSLFISTADPVFDTVFAEFRQAGVTDLIIDLRYNDGGLINTAELLGDYLGGAIATDQVFSKTLLNDKHTASNRTELFESRTNSLNLSRLVVIATPVTASSSELLTNSMEPWVEVSIVGDTTFGKPVGSRNFEFCDRVLRPITFETVNALDEGGYFDGLPVDCQAADDISIPVGADTDPSLVAARILLETGVCPPMSAGPPKPSLRRDVIVPDSSSPLWGLGTPP